MINLFVCGSILRPARDRRDGDNSISGYYRSRGREESHPCDEDVGSCWVVTVLAFCALLVLNRKDLLAWSGIGRSPGTGRAQEQLLAVGIGDIRSVGAVGAVLGHEAIDGDLLALFK